MSSFTQIGTLPFGTCRGALFVPSRNFTILIGDFNQTSCFFIVSGPTTTDFTPRFTFNGTASVRSIVQTAPNEFIICGRQVSAGRAFISSTTRLHTDRIVQVQGAGTDFPLYLTTASQSI